MILRLFLALTIAVGILLGNVAPVMAQSENPITEEQIVQAEELVSKAMAATNAGDFATAEDYWTEILQMFPENPAIWSNRGNSKVSQNKLDAAIADYNKSIELYPNAPDAYLNRGTAWEGLGKYSEAIADYNQVLKFNPEDPAAYNNRGNAEAGLGEWKAAVADYQKASELVPDYAFARANYALALYQIGEKSDALRNMKNLVRKYPKFADMRAALSAALWAEGKIGEAESHWVAALGLDRRYEDLNWVSNIRRWPPAMVSALQKFIALQ